MLTQSRQSCRLCYSSIKHARLKIRPCAFWQFQLEIARSNATHVLPPKSNLEVTPCGLFGAGWLSVTAHSVLPRGSTKRFYSLRDLTNGESFLLWTNAVKSLPVRHLADNADARIQDYDDIKLLMKKRLDGRISDESIVDQDMQLLEILFQHRKGDLDINTLHKEANKLQPANLYELASLLISLEEKVGEEATFLAAPLFQLAAAGGELNAKYSYAQLLRTGQGGVKPSHREAASIFTDLAKQGHPYAQFSLAEMYYSGLGVKQDFEVAFTLYKVSAENGISRGYCMMGNMYLTGKGVESDESKAVEYFTLASDKGDAQGQLSLAHCLSHGKGVDTNLEKAFHYHKLAAEQGHVVAIYNLGTQYFAGKGVDLDMRKAAEYFQKASDLNFPLAQINLGNMFYHGLGVEKDWRKARELYKKAAPTNHNARMLLEELESEMKDLKN